MPDLSDRQLAALRVLAAATRPLHGTRVGAILAEQGYPTRAHWTDGKGWQNTCHALVRRGLVSEIYPRYSHLGMRARGSDFEITNAGRRAVQDA